MSMTASLTEKERELLYYIAGYGFDEDFYRKYGSDHFGSAWLFEVVCRMRYSGGIDWVENDRAVYAVLGSLAKKGLVTSELRDFETESRSGHLLYLDKERFVEVSDR